jgi:hypothetical protein
MCGEAEHHIGEHVVELIAHLMENRSQTGRSEDKIYLPFRDTHPVIYFLQLGPIT